MNSLNGFFSPLSLLFVCSEMKCNYLFILLLKQKESPPYPCYDCSRMGGCGVKKLEMGNEIKKIF